MDEWLSATAIAPGRLKNRVVKTRPALPDCRMYVIILTETTIERPLWTNRGCPQEKFAYRFRYVLDIRFGCKRTPGAINGIPVLPSDHPLAVTVTFLFHIVSIFFFN